MFETRTGFLVHKALDGLAQRHRVFANNLANVETPGFTPSDLPFEAELRKVRDALDSAPDGGSADAAMASYAPTVQADAQTAGRGDGNGVAIDDQVVRMEEDQLNYQALLQVARLQHEILHSAITETAR